MRSFTTTSARGASSASCGSSSGWALAAGRVPGLDALAGAAIRAAAMAYDGAQQQPAPQERPERHPAEARAR